LLPEVARQVITYGFAEEADYRIDQVEKLGASTRFTVHRPGGQPALVLNLNMPGVHNVMNATAALAVACDEGLEDGPIQRGFMSFAGVGRRFTHLGSLAVDGGEVQLVDDYGHHPTEVRATLESSRQIWPEARVVMIYQPHRYTRTRDLYEDFVAVLSHCDVLLLLEVYAAGEEPIAGADSRSLARSIRQRGQLEPIFVEQLEDVTTVLGSVVGPGDVVITQGAGNIGKLAQDLAAVDYLGGASA
jgi:UDP-N-acetylmuramate--alanine ligase